MAQYGIGHDHAAGKARVMRDSAAVELAGVYEPAGWLRNSLGAHAPYDGVHWFGSAQEMLDDPSIVAIAVEGRVSENLAFARAALEHGKHVWLDKPAGDDLEEFGALLRLAAARNLHVQLGYMFRYHAGYQFILDWAASGRLGAIRSVRTRISTGGANDAAWRRWDSHGERAGGLMFILAGHVVDIVVALLGRPHRVSSFARQQTDAFPWYRDNNLAVLEYPGALAVVESVAGEVEPGAARRMEVYGTRGSAILEPIPMWHGTAMPPAGRRCRCRCAPWRACAPSSPLAAGGRRPAVVGAGPLVSCLRNSLAVVESRGRCDRQCLSSGAAPPAVCREFVVPRHPRQRHAGLEPMEPPHLRLCLDVARDGYAAGWQEVPVQVRPRYVESLRAFLATSHGEQPADRTFAHELAVQETLLAAAGLQSLAPVR